MPLPCLVAEAIIVRAVPAKVYTLVPAAVTGAFAVFLNILEREELAAGMVKYSVYDYFDTSFVAELCEMPETQAPQGIADISTRFGQS